MARLCMKMHSLVIFLLTLCHNIIIIYKTMKKFSLFLIIALYSLVASAEPANPTPVTVTQPNGETLQLKLVGDEFYNFNTTSDGYTVININGKWEYATKVGDRLVSSGVMAHDPESRNVHEMQLLSSTTKFLVDLEKTTQARQARATRDKKNEGQSAPVVDYSKFRGLIILINYNDKQFQMSNPNDFYYKLCNTKNYTGFYHQGEFQSCTGSVRDYYYDNSMGQFDPEFDVVGPVNLDFSCYDGGDKYRDVFQAAMDAVDAQVDFSQYDADNDGNIDMVFFLVAGYSSNFSGNNSSYLWPHMSYLYGFDGTYYYLQYDGKRMGRYASSCEIYGWESYGYTVPNAIGTICHEFGHVLGLPDLYDTDYGNSGGQSLHPEGWDVMAGGSSNNYGRTPVGYSLWERWELGFTPQPPELTLGAKSLTAINISNTGYMMSSPNDDEFFLFENRQANKWDSALPGHGLLITRVDYSNPQAWSNNDVNCNPNHNYYELVRAYGTADAGVAFPGSHNVTEINSTTEPALLTWAGDACQFGLAQITETNKIITFNVTADVIPQTLVEDFENMTAESETPTDVLGNFATWSFAKSKLYSGDDAVGSQSCSMTKPSTITMTSDIDAKISKVTVTAINTSGIAAKIVLYYSTDEGATWKSEAITVDNGTNSTLTWRLSINQPVRFKLGQTSGSATKPVLIDDFTIYYTEAKDYSDIMIAGTAVNGVNLGNLAQIDGVEGIVQYFPISNRLRLMESTISINQSAIPAIRSTLQSSTLTISVNGLNNVESLAGAGVVVNSSLPTIINGNGTLNISGHIAGINLPNAGLEVNGGVKLNSYGTYYGLQGNSSNASLIFGGEETVAKFNGGSKSAIHNIKELILNDGLLITQPNGAVFNNGSVVYQDGSDISNTWVVIEKKSVIAGDVNGDGVCNAADVTALYNWILNNDDSALINGDQNNDDIINAGDITTVYNIILGN